MLPNDKDAHRLSASVVMFGEFLDRDERWQPPRLERKAVVHGHCHHKSILGTEPDENVLKKIGVQSRWLDDGCCGMAGAFGFEAGEHYDVSVKCGELGYLPHVRDADSHELVITDGFSCREQAMQLTDRQALHLADVVWMAMRYGPRGPRGPKPEHAAMPSIAQQVASAQLDGAIGLGALAFGAAAGLVAALGKRGAR
jgi:Fe-S oxidoreductase